MTHRFSPLRQFVTISSMTVITLILLLYAIHHSGKHQIDLMRQALIQEAQAHFDNLIIMRRWNAMYGGVYIKQQGEIRPNPHLKDNVLYSTAGDTLIKVNPAWMTRQVAELTNLHGKTYYHITSLMPLNPNNHADEFEARALAGFERDPTQMHYYEFGHDGYFHFIGVLQTETSCLSCHAEQGYELGDVRGGIRVSLPLDLYHAQVALIEGRNLFLMGLLTFLLPSAGYVFYRFLSVTRQRSNTLAQHNELLAIEVAQNTREVTNLLLREKYLRSILRTVADVNELLLNHQDEDTLLRQVCARIAAHQPYCAAALHLCCDSGTTRRYSVNAQGECHLHQDIPLDAHAQSALQLNTWHCVAPTPGIMRIFLPLKLLSIDMGVLEVDSAHNEGFEKEEIAMLCELAADLAFVMRTWRQNLTVQRMEQERIANYEETILSFVNMIEFRDTYTAGHTHRVAEYCGWIAEALGYSAAECARLQQAAILHDIGKIATPDSILLKPERLNSLEYRLIQEHAVVGYEMLAKVNIYHELAVIVRHHHERYDGQGYPDALAGTDIPPLARVIAVADAFDAMTTNRIYKSRKNIEAALDELYKLRGSQFDPHIVDAAIPVLRTRAVVTEASQLPRSELERIRFAYFFYDQLTGLFNEHYLMILLQNEATPELCVHVFNIRSFSIYNRAQGWNAGDALLKLMANALRQYCPESNLFRVKGDYFIILSHSHLELDATQIKNAAQFPEHALALEHRHCDIAAHAAYANIQQMFGNKINICAI
jgi:two-component system, LuxR family, sensor histidine kinase TtrS